MSDIFYRAIKAQDKLDDIFVNRNWPIGATQEPAKHVMQVIALRRKGFTNPRIARTLNLSLNAVKSITRRL